MDAASKVIAVMRADPLRWHLLGVVSALDLPDGWIGAGFVRNAIWDHLHGRPPSAPTGDVDVIWHDPFCVDAAKDRKLEAVLHVVEPAIPWSVKNQARMHGRNADEPYSSVTEAMRYWPETATAVAVRRVGKDDCEVAAPMGLGDLMQLVLRPTPHFAGKKRHIYEGRVRSKGWMKA
ncbi:nucleotidyltransferase family protein [Sphingomonas sp. PL-96]|uniref:nucleotidyltransferase family protein n=1 Tax=Sphingomonas sp. PL-96 TaxID=2887201 RepID=UPI001E4D83E3|nr:nucleotidyltransferase family protein [Sphingomonas sp. PL-96]MCC2975660.1 nucleotidyltransferase family protein [Sphingomonas sp. PL-96]